MMKTSVVKFVVICTWGSNVVFRLIICNIYMNLIHTVKFYVVIGIIFVLFFTMNKNIYGENTKEYVYPDDYPFFKLQLILFNGNWIFLGKLEKMLFISHSEQFYWM